MLSASVSQVPHSALTINKGEERSLKETLALRN